MIFDNYTKLFLEFCLNLCSVDSPMSLALQYCCISTVVTVTFSSSAAIQPTQWLVTFLNQTQIGFLIFYDSKIFFLANRVKSML